MNVADTVLTFVFEKANNVVLSLPTEPTLPTTLTDALTSFLTSLKSWDSFFPATELLTVMAFILVVEGVILIIRFTNWVINKIRGSG